MSDLIDSATRPLISLATRSHILERLTNWPGTVPFSEAILLDAFRSQHIFSLPGQRLQEATLVADESHVASIAFGLRPRSQPNGGGSNRIEKMTSLAQVRQGDSLFQTARSLPR
jgi:hypothetical protein